MINFPVTIIDNFYENPDLVRDFALSLEYFPSIDGSWPGSRTKDLKQIDFQFYKTFTNKVFNLFFDFDQDIPTWRVGSMFQKINSFSTYKEDIKNFGWVHSDHAIMTGIVYLNPDDYLYSGTSIYKLKPGEEDNCPQKTKYLHYSGSDEFNEQEFEIEKKYNNGKYIESIRVENVYNRLLIFEKGVYHGVPTFYSESNEPRLTQVFFVGELTTSALFPLARSKKSYD